MGYPRISVLVPVYNVESYLRRCLESLMLQTYKNFEVILVDDGSVDSSGLICDEFAKKDSRFIVFHNENKNISATREFALQHASGDYIQFVDSDDWIENDMLESMYETAVANDCDIVGCNFYEEYLKTARPVNAFYESKDAFLNAVVGDSWGVVWKLLIRRSLILTEQIHFPSHINGGEDYYFVVQTLFAASKVMSIDKFLYHYNRMNASSTISTPNYKKILEQVEATKLVESFLYNKNCNPGLQDALLRRKFYCKQPLLDFGFDEWNNTFPESNSLMGKLAGKKFRIKYFCARIKSMF